jgi:hypothetical protein
MARHRIEEKNEAEQNRFLKYVVTIISDYRLYLLLVPIIIWCSAGTLLDTNSQ